METDYNIKNRVINSNYLLFQLINDTLHSAE